MSVAFGHAESHACNRPKGKPEEKAQEEEKQKYLKAVYDKFLAVKAQYPNCIYNPPSVLSCIANCPNPMCPGELREDKTYSKMC